METIHVFTVSISGMEGGEAPSVADYFVVAGLDDSVTLLQPPEYVSNTFIKSEKHDLFSIIKRESSSLRIIEIICKSLNRI